MILVAVSVGVGFWRATTEVTLVAAPHVGDAILVGDISVTCERVTIGARCVYVEESRRFESEHEARDYFR